MQGKRLKYCKDQPKKPEGCEVRRHRSSENYRAKTTNRKSGPKRKGKRGEARKAGRAGAGRDQRDPNLKGTSSAESEAIEACQTEKIKTDCSDQNALRSI